MEEKVKITEELHIKIIDSKTKEVIREQIIRPKKGLFWRILAKIFPFIHVSSTVSNYGKEVAAKLFGGISALSINQIGAYISSYEWKTSANSYEATGKLKVNNESNTWTTTDQNYTKVGCRNSSGGTNYHNEITGINVKLLSGQEWWCEIIFTFS